jgi:uncharacterized membrane protein
VSDEQTSPEAVKSDAVEPDAAESDVVVAAVSDGAYTLLVADFNDTGSALSAYEALKQIEDGRHVEIESVLVVTRDAAGQVQVETVTDPSTRRGLAWGIVGGIVLGIFFPPSIIGSAVVLGASGAAIGKAREVHHRKELADELQDAIEPGHSGIVALVSDPGVIEIRKALEKANRIVESSVDKVAADDIRAAAKEASVPEE